MGQITRNPISATPLKVRDPVPSDIEIAQEAELKPIRKLAEELGLEPQELELHGDYKAKVSLDGFTDGLVRARHGKRQSLRPETL